MKLFCPRGLSCLIWMVLFLVAVVVPGTMIRAQTATTTTLAVSPSSSPSSPLPLQTVVTLTATVTAGGTAVSPGLVTFCDATATNCTGLAVLGTAQLTSAETAVLRLIPGSGNHSYHAVFAGTTTYATSTSTTQSVTVEAPSSFPTTTSVASSGSAGNYTLTATVVGIGNTAVGPTGNVDFIDTTDLNRLLGTAALGAPTLAQRFVNATGSPIAVGINPNNVAVGDFNGDGIPDLAVPNPGSNYISILLGDGKGGFAPELPVAADGTPLGVAVGDFNGDGVADLAVANFDPNTLSILLGNGNGTFTEATGAPIAVGTNPDFVAVGDFNRDGIADIAVTNSGASTVSILLGDGSGGFTEVLPRVAVGSLPRDVALGDFNGDGIADLEVANQGSNTVSILLGNGDGTFNTSQVPVGSNPFGVAVGYFNSDGVADLAITNFDDNTVSILLGDGHGTFTQATGSPYAVGNVPRNVSVGDFNGDGIPDVAVTDSNDNDVRILLGIGIGSFTQAPWSPVAVGGRPYGVSVGDFNGDGIPDVAVANLLTNTVSVLLNQVTQTATAVLTGVRIPGGGTHDVNAGYPGDTNFVTSTSPTIPLTGSPVTTTTTLVLSTADTIAFGTPVILTAEVMPYTEGSLTATGMMSFYNGSTLLGTVPISATGEASIKVSTFMVAAHALMAVYAGDTNFVTSTSSLVTLTVNPATIAVSLISSDNPSSYGQTVTFTATVPNGATGTIQFKDEAGDLGVPVTLGGGIATFTTSALMQGTHQIRAAYSGDGSHSAATSDVLLQVVVPAILRVTANNITRTFNQPNGTLGYTITGFLGSDTQANSVTGTPTLFTTASITSPVLPAGQTYPIVIGLGSLASSNYSFVFVNGSLTVTRATPGIGGIAGITLTSSINSAPFGKSVILTVTVPSGATGTVTFADGTTVLGTATITDNTSSLTTAALTVGTHLITATYSGDTNFTAASSVVLAQVVAPVADFTVASSIGRQLIPPGASANFTIVVSSMNGLFTNSVTMSASNLPSGATYTFSPAAVTPGTAGANTTFTVSVPNQNSMASRDRLGPAAFALLLLPFACLKRNRRRPQRLLVWMLVGLTSLGAVSGCGEGGYFSQTEQTYTITVTGTSGNLVRSTTITLTVE